jgi:hypothetical protein
MFDCPCAIWFDEKSQSLLIGDYNNNKLRRVQLNGILFHHPKNTDTLISQHIKGEVTTLCEVNTPLSVVMTANNTILVSSRSHKLYKVTLQGISSIVLH